MYKLIALVWFGAYLVFIVQGLRNHTGPRWLAAAGTLALPLWIQSDWWRVSAGCVGTRSIGILLIWAGFGVVMFLHHVIRRPSEELLHRGSLGRLSGINRAIVRVLVFMPIGWSALNAIRPFDREPAMKEKAIDLLQHCFSWATLALFLIAAVLTLIATVERLRASMRAAGVKIP